MTFQKDLGHFGSISSRTITGAVLSLALGSPAFAQTRSNVPDAQVESDVLKALASTPQLADQTISTTTVYGTVTLSGSVRDENSRNLAENVVSRTSGVKKVIDELTVGAPAGNPAQNGDPSAGTNPTLQSDGTLAPPEDNSALQSPEPPQANQEPPQGNQEANGRAGNPPYDAQGYPAPAQPQTYPQQQQQSYPQQQQQRYPQQPQQSYPQQGSYPRQQPYPQQQQPYPQQGSYPHQQPYPQQPPYPQGQPPYPQQGGQQTTARPYGAQVGGQAVVVPNGALLRVRLNEGLDSKHTQPGTAFDAVVLNDVLAANEVAIPRGATVHGIVAEAEQAGALKGQGELTLRLTQVTLAGRNFPINSDTWSMRGRDKTGNTVGSAVGLGAMGAIIGAVAGGGAGAAVGAGVGGVAGVGASAASGGGQAIILAEAILSFHLAAPAEVTTVSQEEMDRLGSGVQNEQNLRRRAPYPVYGPGPVYYPRPYPYYYSRY